MLFSKTYTHCSGAIRNFQFSFFGKYKSWKYWQKILTTLPSLSFYFLSYALIFFRWAHRASVKGQHSSSDADFHFLSDVLSFYQFPGNYLLFLSLCLLGIMDIIQSTLEVNASSVRQLQGMNPVIWWAFSISNYHAPMNSSPMTRSTR